MITAIGWIGSAVCVWSVMQSDARKLRSLNLAACLVMIVFNLCMGTWSMVVLNVVVAAINIRHLRRLRSDRALEAFVESATAEFASADYVREDHRLQMVSTMPGGHFPLR